MGCSGSTLANQQMETAALFNSALPSTATEEVRQVKHFTGIHVADGIVLTANVSADGSSSLTLIADADVLSKVRSKVDRWGTLVLSRKWGAGSSRVVARALVPGPLTYAGASAQGFLTATSVAGSMVVSNQGQITAKTLESSKPVSIVASSSSSIVVSDGEVPSISVTCSAKSEVLLGELKADRGVVTVSSLSKIEGMTVGIAQITAANSSSVALTVTQHADLTSLSSEVQIGGAGDVTNHAEWACSVSRPVQANSKSAREIFA